MKKCKKCKLGKFLGKLIGIAVVAKCGSVRSVLLRS